jgi:purine-cytosine permease-like protein
VPEVKPISAFKYAITDYDNVTVDTGRLIVTWIGLLVGVTMMTLLGMAVAMMVMSDTHAFDFQAFGMAVGAILAGFGTLLGAFAAYIMLDNKSRPDMTHMVEQ